MGDEGESSGILGKFGAAFGKTAAKAGKKAAQSEAGKRATSAAVKGACDGVRDDMVSRYGAPSPTTAVTPVPTPTEGEKKSAPHSSRPRADDSDDDDDITPYNSYSASSYQSTVKTTYSTRAPKPSLFNKLNFMKRSSNARTSAPRPRPRDPKERIYKLSLSKEPNWDRLPLAQTLYNFKGEQKCDLEFRKGQVIQVMTLTESQDDWWEGKLEDRIGIFPANYVKMMSK